MYFEKLWKTALGFKYTEQFQKKISGDSSSMSHHALGKITLNWR